VTTSKGELSTGLSNVIICLLWSQAGQYSAFFVYLRLVMGFTEQSTAMFIAVVGLLSVIAQTAGLSILMRTVGNKNTIVIGLGKNLRI
jgi:hypothetical protein